MKKYLTIIALVALLLAPAVSEAGLIFRRKASGKATPVRNVLRSPFGGCANGVCR